jgi:uncharacterized membrane protein YbaN (DUF454 family)
MPMDVSPGDSSGTTVPSVEEAAPLNPVWRGLLIMVGTAALILGVVGIVVPVLPTTPFLLVTAACYARASSRLYRWLLGQRSLGPVVAEWRRSRSLPPGVKMRALAMVGLTFAISIIVVDALILRVGLLTTGLILATFLYRMPTASPYVD